MTYGLLRESNAAEANIKFMKPRQVVEAWVNAFNRADVDALAALYAEDAVNHQVAELPVRGLPVLADQTHC